MHTLIVFIFVVIIIVQELLVHEKDQENPKHYNDTFIFASTQIGQITYKNIRGTKRVCLYFSMINYLVPV